MGAAGLWAAGITGLSAAPGPDPAAVYRSIFNDYVSEQLDRAQLRAKKAQQEYSKAIPNTDPKWELKFRLLEAEIRLRQERDADVVSLLETDRAFPSNGDLAIKRDLLLSRSHYHLGLKQQSDSELQAARELAEASSSPLIGEVLRAEGLVQRAAGHWEKAIEDFRESLSIARANHDNWLQTIDLVDLGFANLQTHHYDEALVFSQEAEVTARSLPANKEIEIAVGDKAWAYENLGEHELALAGFKLAAQLAQDIGQTSNRMIWLEDAGLADFRLGNLAEALTLEDQALRIALTLPSDEVTDDLARIQTNLALLSHEQGQDETAATYIKQALQTARRSSRGQVMAYAIFLHAIIAERRGDHLLAGRLLVRAHGLSTDPESRMEIENALGAVGSAHHHSEQADFWYRRSIATFEQERSSVKDETLRLSSFAFGDQIYRDYAAFLIQTHRSTDALRLLDRSRARTLEEGLGMRLGDTDARGKQRYRFDPTEVARRFGSTILFYSLGPQQSYLWAATAQGTHAYALPKIAVVQSLINDYQRAIQASIDPLQTHNAAASALYEALVEPAAALIPDGGKVVVIPDGVLHGLNFETLIKPRGNGLGYWIEDVSVTVSGSISMLAHSRSTEDTGARNILLVGDPVASSPQFDALPHAADEVHRVQQHFAADGQTVVTRAQAIPASYAANAPERFQYIHFVAHGTANRLSPLDSAVVLSPSQLNPEEFKLYARDIVNQPLHAKLVTISACYGSGVRTYQGEGLVGLAWAFLRAGAHNVISALWDVNDDSTPLLMDRLYGEIEAGQTPDAALRAAKLALIHSSSMYRKPFYWAAFQLYAGT